MWLITLIAAPSAALLVLVAPHNHTCCLPSFFVVVIIAAFAALVAINVVPATPINSPLFVAAAHSYVLVSTTWCLLT